MSQFWAAPPPQTVLVPSQPVAPGSDQVVLVLRQIVAEDGTTSLVLSAYSTLDTLMALCGEDQPWVAMRSEAIDGLLDELGVRAVILDAVFDPPTSDPPTSDPTATPTNAPVEG